MSFPLILIRSLAVVAFLGTTGAEAVAQTKVKTATATPAPLKDGAFRRNGKVYRLQAGKASPLTASLRFSNGSTLLTSGTLVAKNGARQLLGEGKAVNMQGEVVIYRDDMMSAQAIERHDEVTTGAKPTVVEIPVTTNLAALGAELQRTNQRLEQLRQLTDLLAERATALATGTTPSPASGQRLQALSQQLRP
ncbi:hypothetical protein HNQ93_003256 [Hymenobacter luteus]|uniref:DUF6799 domain-containing protein n=2 Tax=Hymenobacter TaxID=89966 RepID=A0A7W9T3S5_9BACT|nr:MULTISPECIES: DUF6799 domain-containing protein [Hymenobacter]MBB4602499.1 hypothetical protein [Hymenobacter latericoloratus]MBB6060390.1 hypothetical protein [Hymenobacter luteus]